MNRDHLADRGEELAARVMRLRNEHTRQLTELWLAQSRDWADLIRAIGQYSADVRAARRGRTRSDHRAA